MGGNFSSADADEYIDQEQLDAQFCVECKNSLEQAVAGQAAAESARDDAVNAMTTLKNEKAELQRTLDNTKEDLRQCNAAAQPKKESFDSACNGGGTNTFLWVIIALVVGIIVGMFIAKRYGYIMDRKLGDLLTFKKNTEK